MRWCKRLPSFCNRAGSLGLRSPRSATAIAHLACLDCLFHRFHRSTIGRRPRAITSAAGGLRRSAIVTPGSISLCLDKLERAGLIAAVRSRRWLARRTRFWLAGGPA